MNSYFKLWSLKLQYLLFSSNLVYPEINWTKFMFLNINKAQQHFSTQIIILFFKKEK